MGTEKFWLLRVILATASCITSPALSAEPVVRGRIGGTAELGCSLTSSLYGVMTQNQFPLHVVEWVRLGYNVPILIKFGGYTPRVHPNYKGRVSLAKEASLVVNALTVEDEGWFECRILLLDRTADEFRNGTWTFLSITAPPVFIKLPPAFVEVLLGESVLLSCDALGNPKPTVTWMKEDTTGQETIQVLNGTLSFAKVTRAATGMYKCHVCNSEGNLTHVIQLQVKGPPIIVIPPKDTTLNISQDAVLQCHADAYPSNMTYDWIKEGLNVLNVESLKSRVNILMDGSLLIPDITPEDSGNYSCIPTNGLLTPPSASAYLKVQHPAQVVRMPRETYLPAGMAGTIVCPVQAEPPMLFVNWTKDGASLVLQEYPGWMIDAEGSVHIGTANENASGIYTCTAYNSFGTMGQSEPTKVILKDPPSFHVPPRAEYMQEVGRELVIPCQAQGDPSPNIKWTKVGSTPHSPYTVLSNGSLVLQPLSKDHQGAWECHATNRVATVSKSTMVLVLGTSPHAVTAVSVDPGMDHVNVSWEPGFDGGYTQKFIIWVKPTARGKHEWTSFPVPTSKTSLIVTGLQAATSYQFSILPQNKLGSGPFSELVTIRTHAPTTNPPTLVTSLVTLPAPTLLSINYTAVGVLLQWLPPPEMSPPITGFMLQAKEENGKWVTLDGAITVNVTEVIVQGLIRNSNYELHLLSLGDNIVSEPSESVYISTNGMTMYPAPASLRSFVTDPLMAGVIGGVCFLFVAIFLSLVTACVMNNRRLQRLRKKQDDIQSAFKKTRSRQACLPDNSPDSVLKLKLCPPLNIFPNSTSSSHSDNSFCDKGSHCEYQDQKKQLLSSVSPLPCYTLFESHLGGSSSPVSAIESISRGPDGRFIDQSYPDRSTAKHSEKKKEFTHFPEQVNGEESNSGSFRDSSKASSVKLEKSVAQEPSTGLKVESSFFERPPHSERVKSMTQTLSQHSCSYFNEELGCQDIVLEWASCKSDCQESRACDSLEKYSHWENNFPGPTKRPCPVQRETLMHQADYETVNRNDNMFSGQESKQSLMKEQEKSYSTRHSVQEYDNKQMRSWAGEELEEPVWKAQGIHFRQKNRRPSSLAQQVSGYRRGCYFGETSSPVERLFTSSSSNVQWDISPVTSPTSQVPLLSPSDGNAPNCLLPAATQDTVQDSVAGDFSCSSHTQYTPLSILSPRRDDPTSLSDLGKAETNSQETATKREFSSSSPLAGDVWRKVGEIRTQGNISVFTCPVPCSLQPPDLALEKTQHSLTEKGTSPDSHLPKLSTFLNHSFSEYSTLPCDNKKSKTEDLPSHSSLQSLKHKECVRARSRKSDKCAFTVIPSCVSSLTLLENESEIEQSNVSIVQLSEALKGKKMSHPANISAMQNSTIMEYLSLPGFVEMSVDEPMEDCEQAESTLPSTERENSTLLRVEPDVVPKDWETRSHEHAEGRDDHQRGVLVDLNMPTIPVGQSTSKYVPFSELVHRNKNMTSGSSDTNNIAAHVLAREERNIQPLLPQNNSSFDKQQSTQFSSAKPVVSTAKSMTNIVSNPPYHVQSQVESSSESPQRCQVQRNRTNKVAMRILQDPMPFMKKTISTGAWPSLSGMTQPCQSLRKSTNLGSQKSENYESSRNDLAEICYKDEFPDLDARDRSYNLVHTPASSVPMSSWEGAPSIKPCRDYTLDRPHHSERPYITPPSLLHSHGQAFLESPKFIEASRRKSDSCRHAAGFLEHSNCPSSYREMVRSVQHKYVPQDPPRTFSTHRPAARSDYPRPPDFRRGLQRVFIPRGYSWPSPHQAAFPPGEIQRELYGVVSIGKSSSDPEGRDSTCYGGRASYASQSSGRGSLGPYWHGHFCQSLSITPTLLSSPETTEENERHKGESHFQEQKSKRRNTSVDESYEWDTAECVISPDILEAMKMEKAGMGKVRKLNQDCPYYTTGLQDPQEKGPVFSFPSVSQPPGHQYGRSLSEERFNALMQEFQEYRRAQEFCCQDPSLPPDPESDSGSALL